MNAFLIMSERSSPSKIVAMEARLLESSQRGLRNAVRNNDDAVTMLLVDSEGPLAGSPCAHLQARDGWDLTDASDGVVHLMVEAMETWIIADPDALAAYYGQRFSVSLSVLSIISTG
jgi:hypothetical protein